MRLLFLSILLGSLVNTTVAQTAYHDSLKKYINNYINNHEVVKGEDRKALQFFPVNKTYAVTARLKKSSNSPWFLMATSGKMKQWYRIYGVLTFTINNKELTLNLYQSQSLLQQEQYKSLLFLPFTDANSAISTYAGGRYMDLSVEDIKNGRIKIDFNKAYNPYCAYVSNVYNCPIPPAENNLSVAINAGEKIYGKAH